MLLWCKGIRTLNRNCLCSCFSGSANPLMMLLPLSDQTVINSNGFSHCNSSLKHYVFTNITTISHSNSATVLQIINISVIITIYVIIIITIIVLFAQKENKIKQVRIRVKKSRTMRRNNTHFLPTAPVLLLLLHSYCLLALSTTYSYNLISVFLYFH